MSPSPGKGLSDTYYQLSVGINKFINELERQHPFDLTVENQAGCPWSPSVVGNDRTEGGGPGAELAAGESATVRDMREAGEVRVVGG